MILKEMNNYAIIKAELESIGKKSSYLHCEDNKGSELRSIIAIEDRKAFVKTKTYKDFRKGKLTDDEMRYVMTNFKYTGTSILTLLVSKIKNFNIDRAISCGVLDNILNNPLSNGYFRRPFEDYLKVENHEKELKTLIKFLQNFSSDSTSLGRWILSSVLSRHYFDPSDKLTAESRKGLDCVRENYKAIFNLQIERDISQSFYESTHSLFPYDVLMALRSCPYIDMDFVYSLTSVQNMPHSCSLNTLKEVMRLLLKLLLDDHLDPLLDFNRELQKIEKLRVQLDIDSPMVYLVENSHGSDASKGMDFMLKATSNPTLTKERKEEIYREYFRFDNRAELYNWVRIKTTAMINLQVEDKIVAKYISGLDREDFCAARDCYEQSAKDPKSYPQNETLAVFITQELKFFSEVDREFFEESSQQEILDEYYFSATHYMRGDNLFTWEMANSVNFLKKIIFNAPASISRTNDMVASMNLKNIGFKKYATILEDYSRVNELDRFFTVSKNALRFATKEELYMYKTKIPMSTLSSSIYLPYKVIDYLLKCNENINSEHYAILSPSIVQGLNRNANLSTAEIVEILCRIQRIEQSSIARLNSGRDDDVNVFSLRLNIKEQDKLTVADFNDYYDNLGEGL